MCRFQRFFFVKGFVDYSTMNGSLNKAHTHFLKLHLYLEHFTSIGIQKYHIYQIIHIGIYKTVV